MIDEGVQVHWANKRKSYVILMGGHAKCLRLMTRGEGGVSKILKIRLRNTYMDVAKVKLISNSPSHHTELFLFPRYNFHSVM